MSLNMPTNPFYRLISGILAAGAIFFALASCGVTKWQAQVEKKAEIEWPPNPKPLKVRYLGDLYGAVPAGRSTLSFLTGQQEQGSFGKPSACSIGLDKRWAVSDMLKKGVHLFIPETQKYLFIIKAGDSFIKSPVGVAFDENLNLYVSDSVLNKILKFNPKGEFIAEISSYGKDAFGGQSRKPFGRVTGIATFDGNLYVVDTSHHQIHVFTTRNQYLFSFGGRGVEPGKYNMPTHITVDTSGRIFINDAMNFRIQEVDGEGNYLTHFGNHGDGSGDFAMSKGVAVDPWGTIYVVDTLFDNVQLFTEKGDFALTVGARGSGPGEFWLPSGLFIDHENKLYVCDTYNGRVQIFQLYDLANRGDLAAHADN